MEEEKRSSPEDDTSSSDDDTSESDAELMVTTRIRRVTAGNRYSTVVAQEEAAQDEEDEVAMLFAEGEGEDEDFNSDEGDEDADMSSSDDDDQGPNMAVDDTEGEKEIQKEAKVERARKRKADLALTTIAGIKKKPKLDPTSLRRAPAPKPSKRKERVSWLPDSDVAPGRTSLRKQTILHRAETHAKLKENEEQRLKLKAKREKREREREAEAPKEMTQADRLAEAERVERRNAKSLNRWEAMEKKRAEDQAAKLAALKDRKLEGPVVTWYSSSAKYFGLKENKDTERETPTEGKKRGRKPKALLEQLAAAKLANNGSAPLVPLQSPEVRTTQVQNNPASRPFATTGLVLEPHIDNVTAQREDSGPGAMRGQETTPKDKPQSRIEVEASKDSEAVFLTGIHEYASMQSDSMAKDQSAKSEPTMIATKTGVNETTQILPGPLQSKTSVIEVTDSQKIRKENALSAKGDEPDLNVPSIKPSRPVGDSTSDHNVPSDGPAQHSEITDDISMTDAVDEVSQKEVTEARPHDAVQLSLRDNGNNTTAPQASVDTDNTQSQPAATPVEADPTSTPSASAESQIQVISTRNLVILDRFEDLSDQARHDFGLFYNNRKTTKPVKHSQELCPITGLTARYRDPATGIAYANAAAHKKLQDLKNHKFTWSSMLGCYVGRTNFVARGVPDGFLGT